jgi:hypothetical protein
LKLPKAVFGTRARGAWPWDNFAQIGKEKSDYCVSFGDTTISILKISTSFERFEKNFDGQARVGRFGEILLC